MVCVGLLGALEKKEHPDENRLNPFPLPEVPYFI
jgi:hypothetical protein